MSFASRFVPSPIANAEVLNAGSVLLVAPLASTAAVEPAIVTVTMEAQAASGATSISVVHDKAIAVVLRAGEVLHFGSNRAIVAVETSVPTGATPTSVPVEALAAQIADAATATTWNLKRILAPSDIPNVSSDTMVDRKDLTYGLQGSQVKVGTAFAPQIAAIVHPEDDAFFELIYPASSGAQSIFAHIAYNGGLHAFGSAKVSNLSIPGAINEIQRATFTLDFQAPFAKPTKYEYLTSTEKTSLNSVMRLSGLNVYTP
jgi:hypothetical protein